MDNDFWNDYLATEKLFVPAVITVGFGLIILMILSALNKEITNVDLIVILSIGFAAGNVVKAKMLEKERLLNNKTTNKINPSTTNKASTNQSKNKEIKDKK